MGESVEHGPSQPLTAKDLGPLLDRLTHLRQGIPEIHLGFPRRVDPRNKHLLAGLPKPTDGILHGGVPSAVARLL